MKMEHLFWEKTKAYDVKDSTFTYARWTDKSAAGDNRLMSPLVAIHWSFCRPQNELEQKIKKHWSL